MAYKWYERNFLLWELILPFTVVAIVVGVLKWYNFESALIELLNTSRNPLYTSIASISGAILGFIIAGFSIVYALIDHDELHKVRESNHVSDIKKTYMSAIRSLGFTTLIALLGILLDKDSSPCIYVFYFTFFGMILSTLRVWRCVWILDNLVDIFSLNKSIKKN